MRTHHPVRRQDSGSAAEMATVGEACRVAPRSFPRHVCRTDLLDEVLMRASERALLKKLKVVAAAVAPDQCLRWTGRRRADLSARIPLRCPGALRVLRSRSGTPFHPTDQDETHYERSWAIDAGIRTAGPGNLRAALARIERNREPMPNRIRVRRQTDREPQD